MFNVEKILIEEGEPLDDGITACENCAKTLVEDDLPLVQCDICGRLLGKCCRHFPGGGGYDILCTYC